MGLGHNGTGTKKGQGHNGTYKNGGRPSGPIPLGMGQKTKQNKKSAETQRDWDTVGQEHGRAKTKWDHRTQLDCNIRSGPAF